MHPIRAMSAIAIFGVAAFYCTNLLGTMSLNEMMTTDEQKKTGVSGLTDVQKKQLENWINDKFVLKATPVAATPETIYLQQNIQGGTQLMLSDGSTYEVSPMDRSKATFWLTPSAVTIEPSGDPNYPSKITNTLTNISVNGKLVKTPKVQNPIMH